MKKAAGLFSLIFLLIPFVIKAQDIPTLGFNPNPQSFGMGMAGVSLPSSDPLSFYYNPAILGYSSQINNLSFQFFPQKVNWTGFDGYKFSNSGFSAGYNFNKLLNGLNLCAGVGYISSKFDYLWASGGPSQPKDWFDGYDKYSAIGLGVSLDYYVNLSIGFTVKSIETKLPGLTSEAYISKGLGLNTSANDWGLLLNVPVSKLAFNEYLYKPIENIVLKPTVNLSVGYSRSNIGKEVFYIDPAQSDPLPLTARLGYTLSLGADLQFNSHSINFITYDITIEAEDLLISYDSIGNFSYQGLLGDIKPWRNLIEWTRTDNVTLRKGQKVSLFETFSFLFGSYYEEPSPSIDLPFSKGFGYSNRTSGIVLSTNGLFKLLSWDQSNNAYSKYFLEHFEIQYVKAQWTTNDNVQTDLQAISVLFNRFTF